MEAHKHGKRSCMNGCEQVNEACYIKCSECLSRVEKRTSPFTISVLAFQLHFATFVCFVPSLSATSSTIHSVLQGA